MARAWIALLTGIGLLLAATGIDAQETTPEGATPEGRYDVQAVAEAFAALIVAEDFEAAYAMVNEEVAAAITLEQLEQFWAALKAQVGEYQQTTGTRLDQPSGVVIITLQFALATIDLQIGVDGDGRISAFVFTPTEAPPEAFPIPDYADLDAFTETEVTLGEGELFMPGTLAIPVGDGPFPAVVLIGGSGPTDRDSTIGPNKPLRDIAWGLASRGIAVLRYDERSVAHPQWFADQLFTIEDEIIEDAGLAIDLLRAHGSIDPEQIFVLGHSLGGYAAPRIARQNPELAGIIIAAGIASDFAASILRQAEYLINLDDEISPEEEAALTEIRVSAQAIQGLTEDMADQTLPILGAPASYWIDLAANPAPEIAAELPQRILILQGQRDYQVTVEDDLPLWEAALADRDDVTIRTYPALNHLFMAGEGPSSAEEYDRPGNVDASVIEDIAAWIADGE